MDIYGIPQDQIARVSPALEKVRAGLAAAMATLLPDAGMAVDLDLSERTEDGE